MVRRLPYDDAELQLCVEFDTHDGGTACEPWHDGAKALRREMKISPDVVGAMYSVYWHLKIGGVRCVADFPFTREGKREAEILYAAMRAYVGKLD